METRDATEGSRIAGRGGGGKKSPGREMSPKLVANVERRGEGLPEIGAVWVEIGVEVRGCGDNLIR